MIGTLAVCHRVYHKVTVTQRMDLPRPHWMDGTRMRLRKLDILRISPMAHHFVHPIPVNSFREAVR
jgi:hypothetical protein